MSELSVNFSRLDSVIDHLRDAEGYYQDRIEHLTDVRDDVNGITNEFGYLSSASFQLSQKISELEDYYDDISTFRDRVETFRDLAYDEESGLASRLYEDSYDFMEEMGITPEYATTLFEDLISGVIDGVTDIMSTFQEIGQTIVDWYHEHEHEIRIVMQAVTVIMETKTLCEEAVLVVAGFVFAPESGGMTALASAAGIWGMEKTGTELYYDVQALFAYINGEDELGDFYADRTLQDDYIDQGRSIGEWVNNLTGQDYFDDIGAFVGGARYTCNELGALALSLVSGLGGAGLLGEAYTFPEIYSTLDFSFSLHGGINELISSISSGDGFGSLNDIRNLTFTVIEQTTNIPIATISNFTSELPDVFRDLESQAYESGIISEPVHTVANVAIDYVDSRVNVTGMDSVISTIAHVVNPVAGTAYDIYNFIDSFN